MPVPLANLEDRLFARNVIPAVSVDEDESAEAVLDEILEESTQQVEIRPWWR